MRHTRGKFLDTPLKSRGCTTPHTTPAHPSTVSCATCGGLYPPAKAAKPITPFIIHYSLHIARRLYFSPDKTRKVSNPAVRIATAGIAVGIAVMIMSVSVVFGFKHTIQDKIIGFGCHITVGNFLTLHGFDQAPVVMNDSMLNVIKHIDGVKIASRYCVAQGILKTENDFLGVQIKGVDEHFDTQFIRKNIVSGQLPDFLSSKASNEILLSLAQANKLQLRTGDKVYAYFINGRDVRIRRFKVAGIYKTNLAAFDEVLCYTDYHTISKINAYADDEADGADVIVNDFSLLDTVANRFVAKVNRTIDRNGETYTSLTVTDANPGIFSWLQLLDLNVWIILCLMITVAGFTMISGLLIVILERTNMIGLLKALGMRNRKIRHIFLWLALFTVVRGLIIGNLIAAILIILQKTTGIIKLDPAVYYVAQAPLQVNIPLFILINIAVLIICTLILLLPTMLVTHISPAKVMRYE